MSVILPSIYNKNGLHYKVKDIFFFTSLIKIECVYSFLLFSYKNKTSPGSGEGKPALFFRWGGDGVVWCHILIETIVGNLFGCVMLSAGKRFQWLSNVVAPIDTTPISSVVIYFVHFVLVLNIQSELYIETTERKLKTCPPWYIQVKHYYMNHFERGDGSSLFHSFSFIVTLHNTGEPTVIDKHRQSIDTTDDILFNIL